MRAPVRPISGAWPQALERRLKRFFRPDPNVLLDPATSPAKFRAAMSAIHVGDTIKITEGNRHPIADEMLLEHVDLTGAAIVDIGASDGSTSVDLIRRLPDFGSYVVADLYLSVRAARVLRHLVVHDGEDRCILVAGRWWAAWPAESKAVRLLCRPFEAAASRRTADSQEVLLLNPELLGLMAEDSRITYRVHDVFTPWPAPRPDVLKVANLLRRVYFSEEEIAKGLAALFDSLEEGGHLLLVDDGTRYTGDGKKDRKGADARAGLYRRQGDAFEVVAETPELPEIADQVRQVRREGAREV